MFKNNFIFLSYIFIFIILLSCTHKVTYSGKIIDNNINIKLISSKDELIKKIGTPNYIDPLENKYFYFTEKKIVKNFFNEKNIDKKIIVFKFDKDENILFTKYFDLTNKKNLDFIKQTTPNNIIKQGIIEQIFGGIGKPNTSQ